MVSAERDLRGFEKTGVEWLVVKDFVREVPVTTPTHPQQDSPKAA
jgi:hypothetical protein